MIGIGMVMLSSIYKSFLLLLNTRQIEYLQVGGYAVQYYGYPRETRDLDIWIATHPLNAGKLVDVFQEFAGGSEGRNERINDENRVYCQDPPGAGGMGPGDLPDTGRGDGG